MRLRSGTLRGSTYSSRTSAAEAQRFEDEAGAELLGMPPSPDQDPIYDHTNGVTAAVTASAVIFTPPAGCKYAEIYTDAAVLVRVDNTALASATDPLGLYVPPSVPKVLSVKAGVAVRAISVSGTANVRVMPYKVRS